MKMNRRGFLAGVVACPICAGLALAEGAAHWTYEGHGGAEEWGKLDSKFEACAVGSQQSPMDLRDPVKAEVGALKIDWKPEAFSVANNGHTIQANVAGKSGLSLDGRDYELKQFHFHTPSEHALDGKRTQMEVHFVHAHASGGLLVVGMFMTPGAKHEGFAAIMAAAPKTEGAQTLAAPLDLFAFLPKESARYRYEGSLTTPPCSEVVDWNVLAEPIEVAAEDIDAFKAIFPMNARPLQPANRRFLLRG
jgi:carbonic anhydrase